MHEAQTKLKSTKIQFTQLNNSGILIKYSSNEWPILYILAGKRQVPALRTLLTSCIASRDIIGEDGRQDLYSLDVYNFIQSAHSPRTNGLKTLPDTWNFRRTMTYH